MSNLGKIIKREHDEEMDSSEKQYKCSICNEQFEKASVLLGHLTTHRAEKSGNLCSNDNIKIEGEKTVRSMKKLVKSSLKQEDANGMANLLKYNYNICSKQLEQTSLLMRHLNTHSLEESQGRVKSDIANDTGNYAITTLKHEYDENVVIEDTLYTCNICNKQFEKASVLLRHRNTHSAEGSQGNKICGIDLKIKSDTRNKLYDFVESKTTSNSSDFAKTTVKQEFNDTNSEIQYKCNMCHEKFKNASLLLRHQKLHSAKKQPNNTHYNRQQLSLKNQKPHELLPLDYKIIHPKKNLYECDICGYKSTMFYRLKIHILKHNGVIKPYECHLCSFTCKTMELLKKHLWRHAGEKPFKCIFCSFSTVQQTYLKTHIANHVSQKRYKCPICDFSAASTSTLNKHIKSQKCSHDKPHKCYLCSYEGATLYNLESHLLVHI